MGIEPTSEAWEASPPALTLINLGSHGRELPRTYVPREPATLWSGHVQNYIFDPLICLSVRITRSGSSLCSVSQFLHSSNVSFCARCANMSVTASAYVRPLASPGTSDASLAGRESLSGASCLKSLGCGYTLGQGTHNAHDTRGPQFSRRHSTKSQSVVFPIRSSQMAFAYACTYFISCRDVFHKWTQPPSDRKE